MATNDGYSPYPIGLTALQVKDAINRSHNLDTEFANYVGISTNATAPTIAGGVKDGDIWLDTTNSKYYVARIDTTGTPVLLFFEV